MSRTSLSTADGPQSIPLKVSFHVKQGTTYTQGKMHKAGENTHAQRTERVRGKEGERGMLEGGKQGIASGRDSWVGGFLAVAWGGYLFWGDSANLA